MDTESPGNQTLRVLFLAAEADPFIKVGGLGDVSGSLPQALLNLTPDETAGYKVDVRLVIPFHGAIDTSAFQTRNIATFQVPHTPNPIMARVYATEVNGLNVYLISGSPIVRDAPVYSLDASQDGQKYTFFSLAALELTRQLDWKPDVVHVNDWHTALAAYSLSLRRATDPFFGQARAVITAHNLPFMGAGAEAALSEYALPPATDERLPDWAHALPLPLGLLGADAIVAVSPTYAREILTPEFGCGLQYFLRTRVDSIRGILNGIDTTLWNPVTDRSSIATYSVESLSMRVVNKATLQGRFSMIEDPQTPLLIFVGRMDPQKGVDLIPKALRLISDLNWQAIILGTGVPALEAEARQLEMDFPDRVRAAIRYDSRLSHLMYAGADILLMPSRYEPCGLAQMIAMRYGCVPLAHATGGLVDTIQDALKDSSGTGFLFEENTPETLAATLRKALSLYTNQAAWAALQMRGMQQDFSWNRSAIAYTNQYLDLRNIP